MAAAIVRTGGRVIQEESDQWIRDHGPVGRGTAAVTTGGALQASHVIHVVGPRYREGQDNAGLLAEAVTAALSAAEATELKSLAMPAISAGIFGYPRDEATKVIAGAVCAWFDESEPEFLREVRLVGYDRLSAREFAEALDSL